MKWWIALVLLGALLGWWFGGSTEASAATALAATIGMGLLSKSRHKASAAAKRVKDAAVEAALADRAALEAAERAGEVAEKAEIEKVSLAPSKGWNLPPPWEDG